MSSELKVSIGMPVHNGEAFIRHALDSLLCQTFAGFELIISDNASTDRTEEICREYASRDCRVRYIRQSSNLGATGNFQFVLDQAVGEYFMWAAADDLRSPASIQVMVDALERNKKAIVAVTDYATFTSHDQLSAVPDSNYSAFCGKVSNDIWQSLGTKMHCMHTYGLFRSSTLRLHRLRNVDYAPDYPLVTFVMFAGDIVYAPGGLMYYFDPVPKRTPEQRVLTDSNRTRIRPFRHIRVALHMASSAGDGFRVRRRRSNFIWVFAASYVLLSKTQWYQSMPVPLQQLWKVLKRLFKRTDNLSAAGTATGRKP